MEMGWPKGGLEDNAEIHKIGYFKEFSAIFHKDESKNNGRFK